MIALRRLVPLTALLLLPAPSPAGPADVREDPNVVTLQVTALEMLHRLQATPEQLSALLPMAKAVAPKDGTRKPAKASAVYRKTLIELRDAYLGGDEDAIVSKATDLEELRDKDEPTLDDDVDLTDAARKGAPAGLKLFSPRQVAQYVVEFAEEFPDPFEKITETFEDARMLKGKDWDESRDLAAEQVGWLVGGIDAVAEAKVKKQVAELLDRAHTLKDAEYKAKKGDLTQQAKEIAATVAPTDVIRNFMQRSLAELLSNPQTVTVIEARLKKAK